MVRGDKTSRPRVNHGRWRLTVRRRPNLISECSKIKSNYGVKSVFYLVLHELHRDDEEMSLSRL